MGSLNTPKERIAEYRQIAEGVIDDLNASGRCLVIAAGEAMSGRGWFIHLRCDQELFTVEGDEDVTVPEGRASIRRKIVDEYRARLH